MAKNLQVVTSSQIAGSQIDSVVGLVLGVGNVAFGPITSTKAAEAFSKAMNELKHGAGELGADAVVDLKTTATSAGFPFFRPHTVLLTGTAVKLK